MVEDQHRSYHPVLCPSGRPLGCLSPVSIGNFPLGDKCELGDLAGTDPFLSRTPRQRALTGDVPDYCLAIATESRSSGLIKCDWSSNPWSS